MQGQGDQPSPPDLAKFELDVLENAQDEGYRAATLQADAEQEAYDRQQDALDAQADATEAANTFSTLGSAATSIAARLAKGSKVRREKLDREGGKTGEFETVTVRYPWARR